jgi:hypothetical protein
MSTYKLTRLSGLFNILGALLFLLWWVILGVMVAASGNFNLTTLELVRLNGYQIVSMAGLLACVVGAIGILGLYLARAEKMGNLGLIGGLLSCAGVILYGGMQYDETFTWPILASKAPALLGASGGLMADRAYFGSFLFMGVIFAAGFIVLGIAFWRSRVFPGWAILLFTLGAVLFGIGMSMIFRTVGLIAWVIGWGWMGFLLWKGKMA